MSELVVAVLVFSIILLAIALLWQVYHPKPLQPRRATVQAYGSPSPSFSTAQWFGILGFLVSYILYSYGVSASMIAATLSISVYLMQLKPGSYKHQQSKLHYSSGQPPKQPTYQPPQQFPGYQQSPNCQPPKPLPPQILHRQELHRKLMSLVHNEKTALRLVNDVLKRNPGSSVEWCYEKAIYDVLRDRR